MGSDQIMGMIVMPIFFALIAWIFKLFWDWKRVRLKSDLHHKLVDKFGDVKELNNFLQTETGSNFLKSLTINGLAPKEKLLSSISRGIIIGFLGIAVLLLGWAFAEDAKYFYAAGITIFTLGIGFLVSSAVSYHFCRKWGIIQGEKDQKDQL